MAGRQIDPAAILGAGARHALVALPRRPGVAPRLDRIGWMPGKREPIDRRFRDLTVSLILAGSGRCLFRGRNWAVRAPMLLLFRPGDQARYAPDPDWDEAYCVWSGGQSGLEERLGLAGREAITTLAAPRLAAAWFALLLQLAPSADLSGIAEQMDLAALGLSRAIAGSEALPLPLGPAARVRAATAEIARRLGERLDLVQVARRHGFSASQFRRACIAHLGLPPARWLAAQREAEATRLLAASDAPIAAIAAAVGFADRRHFTRWYRERCGQVPSRVR